MSSKIDINEPLATSLEDEKLTLLRLLYATPTLSAKNADYPFLPTLPTAGTTSQLPAIVTASADSPTNAGVTDVPKANGRVLPPFEAFAASRRSNTGLDLATGGRANVLNSSAKARGFLYMQTEAMGWRRLWCEYQEGENHGDGGLSYRTDEGSKTATGVIKVAFVQECNLDKPAKSKLALSKWDNFYYEIWDNDVKSKRCSEHVFTVFSSHKQFFFHAQNKALLQAFVTTIGRHAQDRYRRFASNKSLKSDHLWKAKVYAFQQLQQLLREQFVREAFRFQQLDNNDSGVGFSGGTEDDHPITSTRKEKSGVLSMESPGENVRWRDYYFVLFEHFLFYYKDSKSTNPTGFISLKNASIQLDKDALALGEHVFTIRTPLKLLKCKTRHPVALSEWLRTLQNSLVKSHTKKERNHIRQRSAKDLLKDIEDIMEDLSSLDTLIHNADAMNGFKDYLAKNKVPIRCMDFIISVEAYKKQANEDKNIRLLQAHKIETMYLVSERKEDIIWLPPPELLKEVDEDLKFASPNLFDACNLHVRKFLQPKFENHKTGKDSGLVRRASSSSMDLIEDISLGHHGKRTQFVFIIKVKDIKLSRRILFSNRKNKFTIGRDKSNDVVIEDGRVSRSHACVEYDDAQCEYIDLGSSCGSKLNGKPVHRVNLQVGDVVEIGQSLIIFQIQKRRRFSFF